MGFNHVQLIIVAVIAFLLFGNRLPSVMRSLGRSVTEFKRGVNGIEDEIESASKSAKKVSDGTIQEELLRTLPLDEARDLLMTVKGVGPKVADCTLLFGLHRLEAFPRDTWIKKAMTELFPEGLPECAAENAGIAQQYIFHYARNMGMLEKNKSK